MKYSMLAVALFSAATSFTTQAKTINYSTSNCVATNGVGVHDYYNGWIENNQADQYGQIICPVPVHQGVDVAKISATFHLAHGNKDHSHGCRMMFRKRDTNSHVAVENNRETIPEQFGVRIEMGPFEIAQQDTKGVLYCNLPGVEISGQGISRFMSYSITYM